MTRFWKLTLYMTGIPLGLGLLLCLGGSDGLASAGILGLALIPIYIIGSIVLAILKESEAAKAMLLSLGLLALLGLSICGLMIASMH